MEMYAMVKKDDFFVRVYRRPGARRMIEHLCGMLRALRLQQCRLNVESFSWEISNIIFLSQHGAYCLF